MSEDSQISAIFANIDSEFELFRQRKPDSLICKFFKERGVPVKYAKSNKGYQTIGVFRNKMISGLAFVIYAPHDLFYGAFVDSKKNGAGHRLYPNGFVYKGEYVNDKKVNGVVSDSRTGLEVYTGDWDNDNYNGQGVLRNPFNKSVYEGAFLHGMFDGHGKLTWSTGDSYIGGFRQGRQDGKGTFILIGIGEYKGNFRGGIFAGKEEMRDLGVEDQENRNPNRQARIEQSFSELSAILGDQRALGVNQREPIVYSGNDRMLEFN